MGNLVPRSPSWKIWQVEIKPSKQWRRHKHSIEYRIHRAKTKKLCVYITLIEEHRTWRIDAFYIEWYLACCLSGERWYLIAQMFLVNTILRNEPDRKQDPMVLAYTAKTAGSAIPLPTGIYLNSMDYFNFNVSELSIFLFHLWLTGFVS